MSNDGSIDYLSTPHHQDGLKRERERHKLQDIDEGVRPAFDCFSWENIRDDQGQPSRKLVQGLLLYGDVSLLAAQPNVGKSAFAVDLGLYVSSGEPWHTRQVDQCTVLYVAAESPLSINQRVRAACWNHPIFKDKRTIPFYTTQDDICLMGPGRMSDFKMKIEAWQRSHHDLGLVIVDTLRSACPGIRENDADDVSPIMQGLSVLARSLGIHIMLIHHTTKTGEEYSGSGVIGAIVDTIIFVRNEVEGEHGCIVATVEKQRQLPCGKQEEFYYTIESAETGRGADNFGDIETAAMVKQLSDNEAECIRKASNEDSVINGATLTESLKSTIMNKLVIFLRTKGRKGHLMEDILEFPEQIGLQHLSRNKTYIKSVIKESESKGGVVKITEVDGEKMVILKDMMV